MKNTSDLRVVVLGAAAGGGLPQWNCGCRNCSAARDPGSSLRPQTQSSLAVSLDGEAWAIFNASPDIRQQVQDNRALQPRRLRHSPIKSVVLTNGDIDHLAGLLVLREKQPFTVFSTGAVAEVIADNPVFGVLDPGLVSTRVVAVEEPFFPLPGLKRGSSPCPARFRFSWKTVIPNLRSKASRRSGSNSAPTANASTTSRVAAR